MGYQSLEELDLNPQEYCFLMEDTKTNSPTFKVFIPKLMPYYWYRVKPTKVQEIVNNNIFINDKTIKPVVSNKILMQNYITLKRFKNCWFRFHPNVIPQATKLVCKIIDKDILNMWLTDDEFDVTTIDKNKSVYIRNPNFEILDFIKSGDRIRFSYGTWDSISSIDGTATSVHDWGIMAIATGWIESKPITPDRILGVYKPPGEFYSYY